MRENIVDYVMVRNNSLGSMEELILDKVHDGWQFLNKHGIKRDENRNQYYVEMVKYEEPALDGSVYDSIMMDVNLAREHIAEGRPVTQEDQFEGYSRDGLDRMGINSRGGDV